MHPVSHVLYPTNVLYPTYVFCILCHVSSVVFLSLSLSCPCVNECPLFVQWLFPHSSLLLYALLNSLCACNDSGVLSLSLSLSDLFFFLHALTLCVSECLSVCVSEIYYLFWICWLKEKLSSLPLQFHFHFASQTLTLSTTFTPHSSLFTIYIPSFPSLPVLLQLPLLTHTPS